MKNLTRLPEIGMMKRMGGMTRKISTRTRRTTTTMMMTRTMMTGTLLGHVGVGHAVEKGNPSEKRKL